MPQLKATLVTLVSVLSALGYGQFEASAWQTDIQFASEEAAPMAFNRESYVVRGQGGGSGGGGGAGAGAATDPSVPLAQMQFQNVFVSETYESSGYSNQFIIQPVIPIHLDFEFFPYHIIRPTLPVIAPTADPDGPQGVEGGLGDLTIIDVVVHPFEKLKTNLGIGYIAVAPTATDPQLGLRKWQLGPTIFAVTKAIPKWNLGALVQVPFSLESDSYTVQMQPIVVRMLPNEWYVGLGDQEWILDDQDGNYSLPINFRIGKVCKFGDQPMNVFLMPYYTPEGLRKGPASKWGVKLSVSLLFPKLQLDGPLFGSRS